MVGVKKFTALAAVSAAAVTGAAASLQPADASHAHHHLLHRAHAERQLHVQQQPSMVKVQKRLTPAIGDGLGGLIGGLVNGLGFTDLDDAEQRLHNLRRGLVGDLLGADGQGGAPPSSSSSRAPAPASTSRAPANNAPAPSTNAPASSRPAASSSPAAASSRPASSGGNTNTNNNNSNTNTNNTPSSASSSSSNSNNNNNGSNQGSTTTSNNNNAADRGSAQQQAAASNAASAATTNGNTAAAAASASASAAAASLISAASASAATGDAAASAAAASLGNSGTSAATAAAATGVNRANSSGSSRSSDGTTKVVVPIVVIAASIAAIAVAWTVIRRIRKRNADDINPRMQPIDKSYHHRSMMGPPLAADGAAFAVGGAAAGLVRDRPRRDSYDSYHAKRPMSTLTEEEGDFSGNAPPMQEVAPYAAVGSAYSGAPTSRLRNYGSARGGANHDDDLPPAHRITDSMYVDDYAAHGAVTPFSDEHGAYDVNYYDGSSTVGYNNRAARGMDAAGTQAAGRPYSPYADLQRSEAGDDERYYEYDRASSSRRDPFAGPSHWSG